MSTKTTIKRVALVAAVALTLGGFSAVSASAANTALTFTSGDGAGTSSTGAGVAGPANSVKVTLAATSGKDSFVAVVGGTVASADTTTAVIASGGASVTRAAAYTGNAVLTVPTPTVGTITLNLYTGANGVYSTTIVESVVITVNATAQSGIYSAAKSSVIIVSGPAVKATLATVDAAVVKPSTAVALTDSSTAAATIQVFYADSLGAGIASASDTVTATITAGPGVIAGQADSTTVGITGTANQYSVSVGTVGGNGYFTFLVYANGQVGTSTITLKNNAGTILGTKTITFAGTTPASVAVAVKKANVLNSTTATNKVFAVTVLDSAGNAITGASPTAAVATGSTVGGTVTCGSYDTTDLVYYCSAQASVAQAALTTDASETYTFTAGTVKTTATVKFVNGVASTVTITGDASVDAGAKITYTLTALNANGNALPDGAYTPGSFIASAAPSASLVSVPFAAADTITLANGVATASTYAPFGSAPLTITWTLAGTAGTANAAGTLTSNTYFVGAGLAKTITGTTVAPVVSVNGSADSALAVDAANAATDAANAAAEEASNATEAASEALAAVNSLATTVASLIAGIKAQLTSLTALIKKIQAKVKA